MRGDQDIRPLNSIHSSVGRERPNVFRAILPIVLLKNQNDCVECRD